MKFSSVLRRNQFSLLRMLQMNFFIVSYPIYQSSSALAQGEHSPKELSLGNKYMRSTGHPEYHPQKFSCMKNTWKAAAIKKVVLGSVQLKNWASDTALLSAHLEMLLAPGVCGGTVTFADDKRGQSLPWLSWGLSGAPGQVRSAHWCFVSSCCLPGITVYFPKFLPDPSAEVGTRVPTL